MSCFVSKKTNVAILISGSGSNMQALIEAMARRGHPGQAVVVISNKPQAGGIEKAKRLGVKTHIINHKDYKTRKDFEADMDAALRAANVDLICCAGFMRVLSPWFVSRWPNRIINIHPSLLPKFKGLNTHERAIMAGEREHGATVHWVNEQLDSGNIIAQKRVPVLPDDTPCTLQDRVLEIEHPLYVSSLLKAIECVNH